MDQTTPDTSANDSDPTAESTTESTSVPSNRPSTAHRIGITLLFLAFGIVGGTAGWQLQSEFDLQVAPLTPTGPRQSHTDPHISLYGFEYAIQALGITPTHSSFTLPGMFVASSASTSPDPEAVKAQMKVEAERRKQNVAPRTNRVAVYLLLLGIPLGAALGLAEGIRRRTITTLLVGPLVSALIVGAAGFLGGTLHSRTANAILGKDIDQYVALMLPQFFAWGTIALGLIVWTLAINPSREAAGKLVTAALAGAALCSLIYVPASEIIFFDDPLELSLPGHPDSFRFWFLFGSGVLSLLIGNAAANLGHRRPTAAD